MGDYYNDLEMIKCADISAVPQGHARRYKGVCRLQRRAAARTERSPIL